VYGEPQEAEKSLTASEALRASEEKLAKLEATEAEVRKLLREAEASRAALLDSLEEQKRSAAALRTSEEQFRSAMEYSPIGKAIVSTDGRWLQVNQAMCQIVGYSLEELLVRDFQSITHPDDLERDLGLVQQMLARTIESYEMEKRYFHKDGHIVWIQLNVSLVWNPDGTPRHFISQVQDITQRKRAEAERSQLTHDLGKRVKELTALHRTARLLQQERPFDQQLLSEFVAFLPSAWQHPEICEARVCFADLEAKTPSWQYTPWMQSVDFRTRDQRAGKIEIAYREERSAAGDSPFVAEEQALLQSLADMLAAYVDRKTAEAALRQTQKLESIGTLAGGIAHDFNNILGAIISYTEVTLQEHAHNAELQENLGEILKASQRAVSLVRQILTFSRRQKQERKPTQLGPVVQEVLKLMRSTLPATIEIRAEITEPLPPVVADVTQIHQVMMNLCTNAAHAMRGKAGVLHVALSAVHRVADLPGRAAAPSHIQLTVSDTGHGMDAATLERIFDPFFTTKAPGEGTGLGLAVVHGIIKEHNGDIYTESKPGVGTTFRIELPVASSQKHDNTASSFRLP
jgi:two-component system, cell cycle sensor histidine kinase and response regulator CckA